MTSDGITTEDWDEIHELALRIVNLSSRGSEREADQAQQDLLVRLDRLDVKYGPRPSLLATRADYVDSPERREELLLRAFGAAKQIRDQNNLVLVATSLASFYIEDVDDQANGTTWLFTLRELLVQVTDAPEQRDLKRLERVLLERLR